MSTDTSKKWTPKRPLLSLEPMQQVKLSLESMKLPLRTLCATWMQAPTAGIHSLRNHESAMTMVGHMQQLELRDKRHNPTLKLTYQDFVDGLRVSFQQWDKNNKPKPGKNNDKSSTIRGNKANPTRLTRGFSSIPHLDGRRKCQSCNKYTEKGNMPSVTIWQTRETEKHSTSMLQFIVY